MVAADDVIDVMPQRQNRCQVDESIDEPVLYEAGAFKEEWEAFLVAPYPHADDS